MEISKSIAKEIALQLSETINQNINMMNTDGIIIASSDPSRIGQLHAGAKKLIDENLDFLAVEDDNTFEGSKAGINLPIMLENELVGTIGITGPINEVLQYGQIIKRMTEILLLETKAKEQKIIEQKARDRFYDEWIIGRLEEKNETEFFRMAGSLSIDPYIPVRIFVLSFKSNPALSDETMTDISRQVRNEIGKKLKGNAFRTATQIVCVMEKENEDKLLDTINDIFSFAKSTYHCDCYAGIDEKGCSFSLHEDYKEAAKALGVSLSRGNAITFYDPLDIDFMLGNISNEARESYIKKLFNGLPEKEISEYLSFADAYIKENGSLIALSERLFIHKNTVKYKINKLTEVTGVDIRTCHGAYVFTLAVNLYFPHLSTLQSSLPSKKALMLS